MSSFARAKLGQWLRHGFRAGVFAFVVWAAANSIWRNFKVAHNSARLVELMEGAVWAKLYELNERLLSLWGEPLRASQDFLGMPWSMTLFGVSFADPVMVLGYFASNGRMPWALVFGLALPIFLAVCFGKVFCSYICPMRLMFDVGQLVRGGLLRLGLPLASFRSQHRLGGWVLLGGLAASVGVGTSVWLLLLPYAGLSASVAALIVSSATAGLVWVPGGLLVLDALVAPGFFCHNLCPQGFLLEQLGRRSWLRLKSDEKVACPETCRACVQVCPYNLSPRDNTHRPGCDNCGACAVICPKRKLARKFSLPVIAFVLCSLMPAIAVAHHNKGLPHYGYFENYPQVPTEETVNITGHWEMGATIFNFQGYDRRSANSPRDVKFFTYIYDLEADAAYMGPAEFEIRLDGKTVTRFSRKAVDEEAVYSTRETLPESGEYELVARVPTAKGTEMARIYFKIELDDAGINWSLVGGMGAPLVLLFGLALLGRTRRGRAKRLRASALGPATTSIALFFFVLLCFTARLASAQAPSPGDHSHHGQHEGHSHHAAPATTKAAPSATPARGTAGQVNAELATSPAKSAGKGHSAHAGMKRSAHAGMKHFRAEDGSVMMVMRGIPPWLLVLSVALLIVLSFVIVEWLGLGKQSRWRFNLLKKKRLYGIARSRAVQAIPQLAALIVFGMVIYAGLAGSQVRNVAPVFVWTIWWAGLIFAVLLVGPVFCFACPWDGLANLVTRLGGFFRIDPLTLGKPTPPWLKSVWPALLLFGILTWAELGLGVTTSPRRTAYMGLGMAALAVTFALTFEKKAFCHYVCPVGRITGMYSNFSPIEIRHRNAYVCERCTTEECKTGNERGYACPTGLSLKVLNQATYCTGCTECIKSCDKRNVALNLRPFGADLHATHLPRLDEAALCLGLLALTLFHGLSMTTAWESFEPGSQSVLRWLKLNWGMSNEVNFTLGMLLALAIPVGLFWLSCQVASRLIKTGVSTYELFLRYSMSLLPVALFYHLAHNAMHLFGEGGNIVSLLSDPLGLGTDYFGTRDISVGHLLSETTLWYVQVGLILIGHLFGIVVAHRTSRQIFSERADATRSLVPVLIVMLLISSGGLSLMALDMNMRAGRM